MAFSTTSRYIHRDPNLLSGEPIIIDTRTSVRAIVEMWHQGESPESIVTELTYLTLAQVFDALSFYQDNQAEINDYIERNRIPDHLIHPLIQAKLQAL